MKKTQTLRPSPTALLDPKCDVSFKAMFTQDTEESNAALKDFISTILNQKVVELELIPNEPPVDEIHELRMSFDVSVKFNNGERADIEMQSQQEKYDYAARAESQVARLLNLNTKKGSKWKTQKVYQISVLDFEIENMQDDNSPLSWYTMKNGSGKKLADRLNIIFFDLIKVHKLFGQPVEKLSKLEKWGLFLSYAGDLRKADYIDSIAKSEEALMNAKSSLSKVSQDEIIWAQQNSLFKARMDYNSNVAAWHEEGYKEGIQQGAHKKAVETAKIFLKDGKYTAEQISALLQIPVDEFTE